MPGGVLTDSVVQLIEGLRAEMQGVRREVSTLNKTVSQMAQTNERRVTRLEADRDHMVGQIGALERGHAEHGEAIGQLFDAEGKEEAATTALTKRRDAWRDWRRWAAGTAVILVASQPWNWHL